MQAILSLSPVILAVLGILVAFSVASWTIIATKLIQVGRVDRQCRAFIEYFWATKDFAAIRAGSAPYAGSPVAALFEAGYAESLHFVDQPPRPEAGARLSAELGAVENVSRSLRKVGAEHIDALEKDLSFLATTASATPFIGLFGTVWGIMNAFRDIGRAGSTSLAIVAPGISEALITTAIGLAVAIPAVIGYNYLQGRIRRLTAVVDGFGYDFLNLVQKALDGRAKGV